MRRYLLAASALALLFAAPAHAADKPDLVSFSAGYMNFDKSEPNRQSADFRAEYRFGTAWQVSQSVGFHPWLGVETTSRNMFYGVGGFLMDWQFSENGIFTWQEGAGYLDSGDQYTMGGTFQFRSQAELGYRFDNDWRVTAAFSHISNAKLTRVNPGAEIIGVYVHVPTHDLFGAFK